MSKEDPYSAAIEALIKLLANKDPRIRFDAAATLAALTK